MDNLQTNRRQRRAEIARLRKAAERHDAIRFTCSYLATAAGLTAAGATLMLPSGETLYISAKAARAMTGKAPAGGVA